VSLVGDIVNGNWQTSVVLLTWLRVHLTARGNNVIWATV
jgi:hypothetical protein